MLALPKTAPGYLLIILLPALLYPGSARLRIFSFERYTIADGLSNNSVNAILQTRDGYLWVATKDGLNRFDGQTFRIFKHDPQDAFSLPENYVMSLLESAEGDLWIGTWGGGLCRYEPRTETFLPHNLPAVDDDYIECLLQTADSTIWFGTFRGLLGEFNPKSGEIKLRPVGRPGFSGEITALGTDHKDRVWISTLGAGLVCYQPDSAFFRSYGPGSSTRRQPSANLNYLFNDADQYLWLSSDEGLERFDLLKGESEKIPLTGDRSLRTFLRQAIISSSGQLWAGAYDYQGLFLLEKEKGNFQPFRHLRGSVDDDQSLSADRIRWIYEDRRHNLWIGTEDGLNKLPVLQPFRQYRHFPLRPGSLGGRVVSSIIEDRDGNMWIGLGGSGFGRVDARSGRVEHFQHQPGNTNSLTGADVVTICEDRSGLLWIGTGDNGLNRFNPQSGKFTHFAAHPGRPGSLASNWIQQILETRSGQFLIGSNDALQVMDRENGTFDLFRPALEPGSKVLPELLSVNALFEDRAENLWIGTWLDGLYKYEPGRRWLSHFMPEPGNSASISSTRITCLFEDNTGQIWIGTHSGGLNRLDPQSGSFTRFTMENGLPNDVVFGITQDKHGFLWISTMNGLARLNPHSGRFRRYDTADGLIHNQFNWRAFQRGQNGDLYFGGINGLVSFHPDSIRIDTLPPATTLTSFKIFDKPVILSKNTLDVTEIELGHAQNFFTIGFRCLDLAPPHKHHYSYRLEGVDPDWVQAGTQTSAVYTDIKPGDYRFLVKSANADGFWGKASEMFIRIRPPWWMTLWFRFLLAMLAAALIFTAYRLRVGQLLKIQQLRLDIAADLHDEIGSNLSSIAVEGELVLNSPGLPPETREHLGDISHTARSTIDAIREIIWFIRPEHDQAGELILHLRETATRLLSGLNWQFDSDPGLIYNPEDLIRRRHIYLIFKEALTNLVRHSSATSCRILLKKEAGHFVLSIRDNGRGFVYDPLQRYSGLANMSIRARRLQADLQIHSQSGGGTEIRLVLPPEGGWKSRRKFLPFIKSEK